ncbi:MAG: hypothetical protein MUE48_12220, partial [Desulfobacterales bacterium]|nr:hypothetical protein [Desulfobacterales bacterium]
IAVVDMEAALTDYTIGGDMYDCIHPRSTGYTKIGAAWYQELIGILPTANAGSDKSVNPGALVSLDGSRSSDSLGTIITYAWTQTGGSPAARLDNPASKVAKFTVRTPPSPWTPRAPATRAGPSTRSAGPRRREARW